MGYSFSEQYEQNENIKEKQILNKERRKKRPLPCDRSSSFLWWTPFCMQSKLPHACCCKLWGAAADTERILPLAKLSVRCFWLGCASEKAEKESLEHATALGVCGSMSVQEQERVLAWGCSLAQLLSSELSTYTSSYKIFSSNFWKMAAARIKEQSIMTFRRYFYCLDTLT